MRTESKAWFLVCAGLLVAQIAALGSLPFELPKPGDRVVHALLFASLALLAWIAVDGRRPGALIGALIVLCGADELRQGLVPGRAADVLDFCAGAAAAALTGAALIWKTGAKPCAES